eukprot:scaffold42096_cov150-Skeletonema_dohrnii-CCMP3373.AAC.4
MTCYARSLVSARECSKEILSWQAAVKFMRNTTHYIYTTRNTTTNSLQSNPLQSNGVHYNPLHVHYIHYKLIRASTHSVLRVR